MNRWKWTLALSVGLTLTATPLFAQFRYDMTVLTARDPDGPPLEVIDLFGIYPPGVMELNGLELLTRVGAQTQARRAATFYLELDWPFPPPPLSILRIDLDRSQLGSGGQQTYTLFPLDRFDQNVVAPAPDERVVVMTGRARAQRLDANGNPTEQQGNVEITVLDSRSGGLEFAFIYYYEGSRVAPTYEFIYLAFSPVAEFFTHRRIVP